MKLANAIASLRKVNACDETIKWLESLDCDWQSAWDRCERGDWMLRLCGKLSASADAYAAAYAAVCAAASYAAYASYAAAYAACAAAGARAATLKQCADIVRTHYPVAPDLKRTEDVTK